MRPRDVPGVPGLGVRMRPRLNDDDRRAAWARAELLTMVRTGRGGRALVLIIRALGAPTLLRVARLIEEKEE